MEDFIEHIEFILFHAAPAFLPSSPHTENLHIPPLLLRSFTSVLSPESPSAAKSRLPFAGKSIFRIYDNLLVFTIILIAREGSINVVYCELMFAFLIVLCTSDGKFGLFY